jgi:hypothetical protein
MNFQESEASEISPCLRLDVSGYLFGGDFSRLFMIFAVYRESWNSWPDNPLSSRSRLRTWKKPCPTTGIWLPPMSRLAYRGRWESSRSRALSVTRLIPSGFSSEYRSPSLQISLIRVCASPSRARTTSSRARSSHSPISAGLPRTNADMSIAWQKPRTFRISRHPDKDCCLTLRELFLTQ